MLQKNLQREAELEHPRIRAVDAKKTSLEQEVQREIYKNAGLSLIRERYYSYYICLDVPEYVNIGDDDELYRFPENKVAVRIEFGRGRITVSSPVIVHSYSAYNQVKNGKIVGKESQKIPYKHPFLDGLSDFNTICTNNYNVSDSLTAEQKIVKHLNIAKNTMMSGYFGDLRPHNRLRKPSFSDMIISKSEVKELNLQITNKKRKGEE